MARFGKAMQQHNGIVTLARREIMQPDSVDVCVFAIHPILAALEKAFRPWRSDCRFAMLLASMVEQRRHVDHRYLDP
jgi:hypothetical protein